MLSDRDHEAIAKLTSALVEMARISSRIEVMWATQAMAIVREAESRQRECPQCKVKFAVGVGTGKRLDAKFCSDAHREMFKSHRRYKSQHSDGG